MKVSKATYMDDGVTIPGILIKRFLRKPVFYAADPDCGWASQVITKTEKSKVIILLGGCGSGKARRSGAAQSKDDVCREVIQVTVDSGKANETLNSDKAQALNSHDHLEFDKDFFFFCTSHCCRSDCRNRSDYCPIADEVREKYGCICGGSNCAAVFKQYQKRPKIM